MQNLSNIYNDVSKNNNIPKQDYKKIAKLNSVKMISLIKESGRFCYRYNPKNNEQLKGYNLLRHCGTLWSLIDIELQLGNEKKYEKEIRSCIDWILNNRTVIYKDGLCLNSKGFGKLGGGGLTILALINVYLYTGDKRYLENAKLFANFIFDLSKNEKEFIHIINLQTNEESDFKSDYYIGEALFALCELYHITQDKKYLQFVLSKIDYLYENNYGVDIQSHWVAYMLQSLYIATLDQKYIIYMYKIVKNIIENPQYILRGRSTPIATRSEALLCFLKLYEYENAYLVRETAEVVVKTLIDNLFLQNKYLLPDGGVVNILDGKNKKVQIDYIQHNSSSFLWAGVLLQ